MSAEHEALREALATIVTGFKVPMSVPLPEYEAIIEESLETADEIMALLPQHAAAVLATLGTVREGFMYEDSDENGTNWSVYIEGDQGTTPVLVVSLGAAAKEATDA